MSFFLDIPDEFTRQSKRLPHEVKKKLEKCLTLLKENPRHPSLKTHKVNRAYGFYSSEVFEAYVDHKYRVTWEYKGKDAIYLRNVDNHDECLRNP